MNEMHYKNYKADAYSDQNGEGQFAGMKILFDDKVGLFPVNLASDNPGNTDD